MMHPRIIEAIEGRITVELQIDVVQAVRDGYNPRLIHFASNDQHACRNVLDRIGKLRGIEPAF